MTNSKQSLSVEELREAYRDGLLTAARMVRRCLGEHIGEECALMIDVDEGVEAHKPTLIYVAESIERRAANARARAHRRTIAAMTNSKPHCSTCGADDPNENEYCSNGFHAPGETYWPGEDKPLGIETLPGELRSHATALYRPDHPTCLLLWKAAAAIEAYEQAALSGSPEG